MFKNATLYGKVAGYKSAASMARQRAFWHKNAGRHVEAVVWTEKADYWEAKADSFLKQIEKRD